jgi:DnaJ-class molecular chaperone
VNKYHPDRNKSNKEWAENKFHDINEAFEILYNRNSRAHYDEVYKKGYSLGDAELTFNKFFAEHDFINEE